MGIKEIKEKIGPRRALEGEHFANAYLINANIISQFWNNKKTFQNPYDGRQGRKEIV